MDDEDTLLPRKLQAALEQALERKSELISQDSDSDSDDGEGRTFLLWVWTSDLEICTVRWGLSGWRSLGVGTGSL